MTRTSCSWHEEGGRRFDGTGRRGERGRRRRSAVTIPAACRRRRRPRSAPSRGRPAGGPRRILQRLPLPTPQPAAVVVARHHRSYGSPARTDSGMPVTASVTDADGAAARVDDREPGPAVAQEELVLGAVERQVLGTATGSASITSDRQALDGGADDRVSTSAPLAACDREDADESHPDAADDVRAKRTARQRRSSEGPQTRPRRAAKRVARLRSPVRHQAIARAMRPPSSGKPGIRLNTSTTALMKAR